MARKQASVAEDIMDLVARLPWWAGVALAAVIYLVLNAFSKPPVISAAPTPTAVLAQTPQIIYAQLASIGKYLIPALCLLGAFISFVRRRKRTALVQEVASKGGPALDAMSWREFEWTVGEAFRLDGYSVTETGGGGPDGGVDLVLRKDGKTYLVQCKQRRNGIIDVATVRELVGVLSDRAAFGAFVVTSGRFTPDAEAFASRNNIQLVDRDRLLARVPRGPRVTRAVETRPSPVQTTPENHEKVDGVQPSPGCPKCGSAMVKRKARRGAAAGSYFWGCSSYPKCHGTLSVSSASGNAA